MDVTPGFWGTVSRELFQRDERGFPSLDGIRAIAVLVIVMFHTSAFVTLVGSKGAPPAPNGPVRAFLRELWLGVDIFFVLSGFLIGRILLAQLKKNGAIDYGSFYIRRAARIFPAYYVVLTLGVFVLSWWSAFEIIYGHIPFGELVQRSLKNYSYLANYLRDPKRPDAMGWAWSLCVEEHFYLVLPLTLGLLWRASPRVRLAALVLLSFCPLLFRAIAFHRNRTLMLWDWIQWESHTHADGLLMGVVIAYLHLYHPAEFSRVVKRLQVPMLVVAVLCFAAVFWRGGLFHSAPYAVVWQLFGISLGTAMVLSTCLVADNPLTRLLARPFWYPIARVSYGMYLIHPFIILALLRVHDGLAQTIRQSTPYLVAYSLVAIAGTFLVASVLFVVVELPALRWGMRRTQPAPQPS